VLPRETLFLALTRPALKWGVPVEAFYLNAVGTFFVGYALSAPTIWRCPLLFWALGIPIHLGLREVTGLDYHWCRQLMLWFYTFVYPELDALPTRTETEWSEVASSV